MAAENNGNGIYKYLLGALFAVTLPIAGYAVTAPATSLTERVVKAEDKADKAMEKADKVEVIEVEIKYLREDVSKIEELLKEELRTHKRLE